MNPLLELAQQIGENNPEKKEDIAEPERGSAENNIGSYERFMSSFGSPARWAGRS